MENTENHSQASSDSVRDQRPHSARYLVIFGPKEAPRAALLDVRKRLMTEMMDADGFIVERLTRRGVPCVPPAPAALETLLSSTQLEHCTNLRCFALD